MTDTLIEAAPGLANIVAADTAIGDVRGDEGFYHYGPYSAVDLAATRTFEEVWFLFVRGRLPTRDEAAEFAAHTATLRAIFDGAVTTRMAIVTRDEQPAPAVAALVDAVAVRTARSATPRAVLTAA